MNQELTFLHSSRLSHTLSFFVYSSLPIGKSQMVLTLTSAISPIGKGAAATRQQDKQFVSLAATLPPANSRLIAKG